VTAAAETAPPDAEAPSPALLPPASAMHGPAGDRRGDRRGRRSRRGRGGRDRGRGLPDSKFYSPRQEGEHRYQPPPAQGEVAPAEPPAADTGEADDFLVLPGESLAKYTEADDVEQASWPAHEAEPEPESGESASAEPEAEPEAVTAPEPALQEDAAPAEEPMPDLLVREAVAEARAEGVQAAAEAVLEKEAAAVPVEEHLAVEALPEAELEPEPVADETPYDTPDTEIDLLAAAVEVLEAADAEAASVAAEAAVEGETRIEEEGPEPARIPTSLTATLREQGQRHLHRISRRTRRRGRGGDRGPAQEGQPRQQLPGEGRVEQRSAPDRRGPQETRAERSAAPSISDLLKEGQEIIVQIAKEPLGQKGARITSHIALPGRFLVYMPTVDHIGVSRKIPSDEERQRLKRVLQGNRTGIPGGFIVRTAGEGRSEEELRADMHFLYNLWLDLRQKAERRSAPALIHHDLNVVERILRDQLTSAYKSVWVDNEEVYEAVLRFVQRFQPALVNRVRMYTRPTPIFDEFGITAELEKALRPKVWLKSGGYIVINQTEALVAIDINTGKYVGKSARLEDTIVKTNTDAIKEIVRQIRLRDLGGIIVVDFIDMDERKNRQKVMQALEEAMRADRAPYKILQFNDFGLVAITRKRVKQSLERTLCTPCPYCEGAGYVKSPQTVVGEILQEAQKIAKAIDTKDVMLRVSPDVAKLLKSNQNTYLQELEEILGRAVFVKSDHQLHQEKFDLA